MSVRTFVRVVVGVFAVAVFSAAATSAAALTLTPSDPLLPLPGAILSGSTGYQKSATTVHVDRAPSVPGATTAPAAVVGPYIAPPAVPMPDGSGIGSTHVAAGSSMTSLSGFLGATGGTNLISFTYFKDGDIAVVLDPTSLTGHAGLFDRRFYTDIRSYALLSANVAPANGVQREQCLKYRAYERAWGLWVPKEANHGIAARNFAYGKIGRPYSVAAAKTDLRSFYCSKIVWAAWRYTSGLDLDADGGFWVWPVDIVNSRYTSAFGYWS